MRKLAILAVALIFCLVIPNPVRSEIYRWIDEKGGVHFTEDPATIPEKYRNHIDRRTTDEDLMTIEERISEKKRSEDAATKRQIEEQKVYKRSLRDEEIRKERRRHEIEQDEEKLRVEKEEKTRKLEETKKQEEQGPEYENVTCPRCNGAGIIWKTTRVPKNKIGNIQLWDEIQIATKCEDCNGKGFTIRRVK
jgi:hypothetical protein